MNAHWVKWVSVLSLALAGSLVVACSSDDDDDDDNNGGRGGRSGAGGSNTGGSNTGGSNVGGSGGGGGGVGGAGGGAMPAPPPSDKAGVIGAFNARKYDPVDFAAALPKWVCEEETTPKAENSPHGVENRTCSNFQLAGVDAADCTDGKYNVNAASAKEAYDADGKMIGFVWYVKTANGYFWFSAPVTGASGQERIDESDSGKIYASLNDEGGKCESCHSQTPNGANPNEFSRKGHTLSRSNDLLVPAPSDCGISE